MKLTNIADEINCEPHVFCCQNKQTSTPLEINFLLMNRTGFLMISWHFKRIRKVPTTQAFRNAIISTYFLSKRLQVVGEISTHLAASITARTHARSH